MNPIEQQMLNVAEDTFASLAFMFPLDDSEAASGGEAGERASVNFSGPVAGKLLIDAPTEMLDPLAANMLGLDDGETPSPDHKRDAFKELLNVICGNLLPVIASPRDVFNVHEPQVLDAGQPADAAAGLALAGSVNLALETGVVRLALLIDVLSAVMLEEVPG